MITKEEYIVIHTLKSKGHSIRAISKIVGLNRRTVTKRLKEDSLLPLRQRSLKSKLDPFKIYITKRVIQALPFAIPSSVIYEEIKKNGYKGKIRILQSFIKSISQEKIKQEVIRFETKPGYQAQVDWTFIRSGKNPIYAFVMVLGYSRMAFVYFTNNMSQSSFQDCHIKAFEYFGGVTKSILYDNLKSVVIKRDKYGKNQHGFNNDFLDFSKHNFVPKLCKPYRAQTKGKVERFNHYLKNNFYEPLKASLKGGGFAVSVELLNSRIFSWLEYANKRVHDTTKRRPFDLYKEEKSTLDPVYLDIKPISCASFKDVRNLQKRSSAKEIDIDISYHTQIQDYEKLLSANKRIPNVN